MTSNQHYGGLNNRFDKRATLLRRFGFKYQRIDELNIAVFTRKLFAQKSQTIPVATLHYADKRSWQDELASTLKRTI